MNVLFLDCDGVINTIDDVLSSKDNIELEIDGCVIYGCYYRPELVRNINSLCDRYNLKVVLSSTWRKDHELAYMKQLFKYIGLSCQLIDYTMTSSLPYNKGHNDLRGLQIKKWLSENKVDDYLVIDDIYGAGAYQHKRRFIHVDSFRGFDYNSYKATIDKFDKIFEGKDGSSKFI